MLDLAQGQYTADQIADMLRGKTGSRKIGFRYDLLSRYGVKIGEIQTPTYSSNLINFNSKAKIKRTGRFNITESEALDIDYLNDYINPVMLLHLPDGSVAEWSLGVFMMSSPLRTHRNASVVRDIEAYDKTLIAYDDKLTSRYILARGSVYTDVINTLLDGLGIWQKRITPSAATTQMVKEWEIGTPKLDIINQLLSEINYNSLWADAAGFFRSDPYIFPDDRSVDFIYRTDRKSIILDESKVELDLFSVPNKWVVVASNPDRAVLKSSYTNEMPASKTSTVSRGRTIVEYVQVDDIYDQTSLDNYAKRLAYERSLAYTTVELRTALMPHHTNQDCIYIEHDALGISDKYIEVEWDMELKPGGAMTHVLERVIIL